MWQEQRRFALRHLRDLGFGKTSAENLIQEEIQDLIEEIRVEAEASGGVVDFCERFNLSLLNVLWAVVSGERYKHDDAKLKKLITAVNMIIRRGNPLRAAIPVPKILLAIFPSLTGFLGIPPADLFAPLQDFIRV